MPTLTYNGTTATLPPDLLWTDEYAWSAVQQETGYSTTGALLIDAGTRLAGRPITLEGGDQHGWATRALCESLRAWAALPAITLSLVHNGTTRTVIFDHARTGFEARPIVDYADPIPGDYYSVTLRFLELP